MQANTSNLENLRPSARANNQLRDIEIIRKYTKHAEGSVLVKFGDTHVLCTASVDEKVPGFLKGKGQGWVTAVSYTHLDVYKRQHLPQTSPGDIVCALKLSPERYLPV